MDALPAHLPSDGEEVLTGLTCPDCSGALLLRVREQHISFVCRVGHAYSIAELTFGKEDVLERRMWMAVYAFEEIAALLADLLRHGIADEVNPMECERRSDIAREQAARLR